MELLTLQRVCDVLFGFLDPCNILKYRLLMLYYLIFPTRKADVLNWPGVCNLERLKINLLRDINRVTPKENGTDNLH